MFIERFSSRNQNYFIEVSSFSMFLTSRNYNKINKLGSEARVSVESRDRLKGGIYDVEDKYLLLLSRVKV